MKFRSYTHIENAYNRELYEKAIDLGFGHPSIPYICAVKIDGSNFQVSIDEDEKLQIGSRNQLLSLDADFMNWKEVIEKDDVEERIRKMKTLIRSGAVEDDDIKKFFNEIGETKFNLTVFGELCGGLYRHPDVPKNTKAVRIQGRVDYSPDNEWIPFDIMLSTEETSIYLNQDLMMILCERVGLKHQIVVFKGTLQECMAFPIDFQDKTGNFFWNLPLIEGNTAEGVVIKPVKYMCFPNGSRVIFKNKNTAFKERIRKTKTLNLERPNQLYPEEQEIYDILSEYFNENRVLSVLSKIGKITNKDFQKLAGLVMQDAYAEFMEENRALVEKYENSMDPKEFSLKKVRTALQPIVNDVVRPVFLKNISVEEI